MSEKFWQSKSLQEMNKDEWEAICDGCAKCCLHKFIHDDEESREGPTDHIRPGEEIIYTNIVCGLLNTKTCACTRYEERSHLVPDCVTLSKDNLDGIFFMPPSCSYRLLYEGKELPSWHPLLNKGKKSAMHQAGMSVRGKTVFDHDVDIEDFEDHICEWPVEVKD